MADVVSTIATGMIVELSVRLMGNLPGLFKSRLRRSPEERMFSQALAEALAVSLRQASADPTGTTTIDDDCLEQVASALIPAFSETACLHLVNCLSDSSEDAALRFQSSAELQFREVIQTIDVPHERIDLPEFLHRLPLNLYDALRSSALLSGSPLRPLVTQLVNQRAADFDPHPRQGQSSPSEYRSDIVALLQGLLDDARANLPRYIPSGIEIETVAQRPRLRAGIESSHDQRLKTDDTPSSDISNPLGRSLATPLTTWEEVVDSNRQIVVVGDPGSGKSWLVRLDTIRKVSEANNLISMGSGIDKIVIPIAVRCDELVDGDANSFAELVAQALVARGILAQRSRFRLIDQVAAGDSAMVLDGLDEIQNPRDRARLEHLLTTWVRETNGRVLITCRTAGYESRPLAIESAVETQLLAYAESEIESAISVWPLNAEERLRVDRWMNDSRTRGLARSPLMVALVCAMAATDADVPNTRVELYDSVLRRFLAEDHRSGGGRPGRGFETERLVSVLSALAFQMATGADGWVERCTGTRLIGMIKRLDPERPLSTSEASDLLHELSVEAGILLPSHHPADRREPTYRFMHRSFAEYMVATHLACLEEVERNRLIDRYWGSDDWFYVVEMLGATLCQQGRPEEAFRLIRRLGVLPNDPFCWGLKTALGMISELPPWAIVPSETILEIWRRLHRLFDSELGAREVVDFVSYRIDGLMAEFGIHLVALLSDEASNAAAWAASILVRSADSESVPALLRFLDSEEAAPIHPSWIEATTVPPVAKKVMSKYLQKAGEVGTFEPQPLSSDGLSGFLAEFFSSPNAGARATAVSMIALAPDSTYWRDLFQMLESDTSRFVRLAVVNRLDVSDPRAIEVLERVFLDDDELIRAVSIQKLVELGNRPAPDLIEYSRHTSDAVRLAAARALALFSHDQRCTAPLLDLLDDESASVKKAAIRSLAKHDQAPVRERLYTLLQDSDYAYSAAEALRHQSRSLDVEHILYLLEASDESRSRSALTIAIGNPHFPAAAQALVDLFTDADEDVRLIALRGFESLDDDDTPGEVVLNRPTLAGLRPGILQALFEAYRVGDGEVRRLIIRSVGPVSDPLVHELLASGLTDDSDQVQAAAMRALEAWGGVPGLVAIAAAVDSDSISVTTPLLYRLTKSMVSRLWHDNDQALAALLPAFDRLTNRFVEYRSTRSLAISGEAKEDDLIGVNGEPLGVVFLTSTNLNLQDVYVYLQLPLDRVLEVKMLLELGVIFTPSDYGEVLAAGLGHPTTEVIEEIAKQHTLLPMEPM